MHYQSAQLTRSFTVFNQLITMLEITQLTYEIQELLGIHYYRKFTCSSCSTELSAGAAWYANHMTTEFAYRASEYSKHDFSLYTMMERLALQTLCMSHRTPANLAATVLRYLEVAADSPDFFILDQELKDFLPSLRLILAPLIELSSVDRLTLSFRTRRFLASDNFANFRRSTFEAVTSLHNPHSREFAWHLAVKVIEQLRRQSIYYHTNNISDEVLRSTAASDDVQSGDSVIDRTMTRRLAPTNTTLNADTDPDCAICLAEVDDHAVRCRVCTKPFHRACVTEWARNCWADQTTSDRVFPCPHCRSDWRYWWWRQLWTAAWGTRRENVMGNQNRSDMDILILVDDLSEPDFLIGDDRFRTLDFLLDVSDWNDLLFGNQSQQLD